MTRVHIEQGTVEGIENRGVHAFLGMPYAAAPIGERRWRPPLPPESWDGVREAKVFGSACLQRGGASFDLRVQDQSEDCLFLNVWTSTLARDARQPVMIWIHGGGNLGGAGSEDAFDGTQLAQRGITVVTFNYRLGAFGFLAHPDIGSNFAVLDHVAALSWVASNIAAFGGDPSNVTIFGQSAGAVAVRTLLSVSRARGLFHRAIIQSAGFEPFAFASPPSYKRVQKATESLFDRLGSRDLRTLQQIPAQEILNVSTALSGVFPQPGQVHTPANLVWNPVVDGDVVAEYDFLGWAPNVPIMSGYVENEARYFIKPTRTYTRDTLVQMANVLSGSRSNDVLAFFDQIDGTWYEALDWLFTTAIWTEPALATLKRFDRLGRHVYAYHFARVSPGARRTDELAKHTAEIRYVFGNLAPADAYDTADAAISQAMQGAWITFARTGVPCNPDESPWPRYERTAPFLTWIENEMTSRPFVIDELTTMIHSLRNEYIDKNTFIN
jgi:para-nitrobenzyl esterase